VEWLAAERAGGGKDPWEMEEVKAVALDEAERQMKIE